MCRNRKGRKLLSINELLFCTYHYVCPQIEAFNFRLKELYWGHFGISFKVYIYDNIANIYWYVIFKKVYVYLSYIHLSFSLYVCVLTFKLPLFYFVFIYLVFYLFCYYIYYILRMHEEMMMNGIYWSSNEHWATLS